jgi:hypothetical protein
MSKTPYSYCAEQGVYWRVPFTNCCVEPTGKPPVAP